MKSGSEVRIHAPMTAAYMKDFFEANGGSKGDHEVYARVESGKIVVYVVKRMSQQPEDGFNAKIWDSRVIPQFPEEV